VIKLSDYELKLSKKGWLINILLLVVVTLIGLILLWSGLNNAFYSSSSTAQSIFKIITYLGEPIVFIVVVAVFYIVYDKKFAKNLAVSLLITVYLNELLKNIFKDPRPLTNTNSENITPENPAGLIETSYGFPSGHTQSAVGTWGYVAYHFKDRPKPFVVPIIMGIITFLVAISRIIIGVHDLQDIVGGFAFGLGALLLFIYLEPITSKQFNKLSMIMKIVVLVVASLVLFLVGVLLYPTSGTDLLPTPVPFSDTGNFALVGGVVLGFGIGYVLEHEKIKYEPSKLNTKQKIVALIIGLVLVFVVYFALEAPKGIFDSVIYRYVRYALISFILIYFLPYIYKKIWKF
jgi:membrane-associated phospholipid phosphatase